MNAQQNKRESISKCIFSVFVLLVTAVVFVFGVFSVMRKLQQSVSSDGIAPVKEVSFLSEYPFPKAKESTETASKSALEAFESKYLSRFSSIKDAVTEYSGEKNPLSPFFFNLFGTTNRILGRNLTEGTDRDAYKLSDGKMVFLVKYQISEKYFNKIADFSSWLDARGTDFLSVIPIALCDDTAYEYPVGFETGYSAQLAYKLDFFDAHGISYLDTAPVLLSESPDMSDWLYKTDHHWTVQAGILAADAIAEHLADDFGYPVDRTVCDRENFRSVTYPNAMLGSLGRKTTLGYTKAEDMEVLYPDFVTDFYATVPAEGVAREGEMKGTLILPSYIDRDYYAGRAYSAFLYGDEALIRIENRMCNNGVRILVLKESKANIVNPYLACAVQYLDVIDPRWFSGSIRTYIEKPTPISCSCFLSDRVPIKIPLGL